MHCQLSVVMHLLRAIGAVTLLAVTLFMLPEPLAMFFALIGAMLLLGGCPMCWLMGLIEKLKDKHAKKLFNEAK